MIRQDAAARPLFSPLSRPQSKGAGSCMATASFPPPLPGAEILVMLFKKSKLPFLFFSLYHASPSSVNNHDQRVFFPALPPPPAGSTLRRTMPGYLPFLAAATGDCPPWSVGRVPFAGDWLFSPQWSTCFPFRSLAWRAPGRPSPSPFSFFLIAAFNWMTTARIVRPVPPFPLTFSEGRADDFFF